MITKKDERWIKLASKLCHNSRHNHYKFASLLIRGGKLIKIGYNRNSRPKKFIEPVEHNLHHHAEIDAIFYVDKKQIKASTLYVYAVTNAGNLVFTRPCKSCLSTLKKFKVKRVVFISTCGSILEEYL